VLPPGPFHHQDPVPLLFGPSNARFSCLFIRHVVLIAGESVPKKIFSQFSLEILDFGGDLQYIGGKDSWEFVGATGWAPTQFEEKRGGEIGKS
jgi:hypothetical protein